MTNCGLREIGRGEYDKRHYKKKKYCLLGMICEVNMALFSDIFEDCTSYGTKIKADEYAATGRYAIVDQGQKDIAGYTDRADGVYLDVPVLVFGDHTRIIKYIDQPFFLGADGVKLLKAKSKYANYKYLYYALRSVYIPNTGYNRHFKWLKETEIRIPDIGTQREIVCILDKLNALIVNRKCQLTELDTLIKARFVEMFGDLLLNPMAWDEYPLGAVCDKVVRYPTFCGMEYLPSGTRVIRIGNILPDGHMELNDENYVFVYETVNEDFPETAIELHDIVMAVRGDGSAAKRIGIVTEPSLINANISPNLIRIKVNNTILNPIYMFYYLTGEVGQKRLDAYVNKTAKKNIAAKDIVKIVTPVPPLLLQNDFAAFVAQVDKSKIVA